jgi:hypothetical protein
MILLYVLKMDHYQTEIHLLLLAGCWERLSQEMHLLIELVQTPKAQYNLNSKIFEVWRQIHKLSKSILCPELVYK